ncbi:MAG TPA: SpoIIE family protein phosphatase [Solirubrobacteraceae bacterium]|nr:SpoIIE family protein phosphatase [Solirubrobacteraceae bacterium]
MSAPFEPLPPPTGAQSSRRRLLLVEDDAGDALLVQERLADSWPDLEVLAASSLVEAESQLQRPVDCILLDLGLPDVRGIEALHRLTDAAPETAIVVLTGDSDKARAIEALTAGAQDYIVKGEVDAQGLARAIGYSIQRKYSERTARELAVLRVQSAETTRVQRGLVPHPLVEDHRIGVRSAYHPGNRRQVLGGDFFDVVQTAPDTVHAVLGDVCGRGPDEAALGVQLRIAWRTLTLAGAEPQRMLGVLDRLANTERHADHIFATLATLRVDLARGRASVTLAGHPAPVLVADGAARLLVDRAGGPPLGLDNPQGWHSAEVDLGSRWMLLLYSDGVYEGRVAAEGRRLGLEGFVDLVAARVAPAQEDGPGSSAASERLWRDLPETLVGAVEQLNEGPLDDDVALLAMRFDDDRD